MKKNVLITGWNGFLGSYLCSAYRDNDFNVIKLGRSEKSHIFWDFQDPAPEIALNADYVVHSGGLAHLNPEPANTDIYSNINVDGTGKLLKLLTNNPPILFIFISSVSVYGAEKGSAIDENSKPSPKSNYAKSKLEAESMVTDWCKKNGVKCYILRLPLVVGRNPPGNLEKLINAIKSERFLLVGDGSARRSMVLAQDVASWSVKLESHPEGVYNLTDDFDPSYSELCDVICKTCKLPEVKRAPKFIILVIAYSFDIINKIANTSFSVNTKNYKQLTSHLTFSCKKAKVQGWNPRQVLHMGKTWL